MHVSNIATHLAPPTPPSGGPGLSSGQSGNGFQTAMMSRSAFNPPSGSGVSATVSQSLASQTTSALLQTQELDQTQVHGGGGGGGGGHHNNIKLMPGLEAEEAGESEGAQNMRARKKLAKAVKPTDVSETAELDENGLPVTGDARQAEAQRENDPGNLQSGLG